MPRKAQSRTARERRPARKKTRRELPTDLPDVVAPVSPGDPPPAPRAIAPDAMAEVEVSPLVDQIEEHTESSPVLSGGDVDAAWQDADSGEETVGGTAPTPDQDSVEEIGEALGVTYRPEEPLHTTEKIMRRDSERWELDPASSEDFAERDQELRREPVRAERAAGARETARSGARQRSAKKR